MEAPTKTQQHCYETILSNMVKKSTGYSFINFNLVYIKVTKLIKVSKSRTLQYYKE